MYYCIQIWHVHVIQQMCLPYCKYELHCNYAQWAYKPNIFVYMYQNTMNYSIYFTCYSHVYAKTNMPLKCQICHMCKLGAVIRQASQYMPHDLCIQPYYHEHWYILKYWHMPLTNTPATLHVYMPLHWYCNLNIDPHYSIFKPKNACPQQTCPSNATHLN